MHQILVKYTSNFFDSTKTFYFDYMSYIGQWAEQEKAFRMTADGTDLVGGK